MKAPITTLLPAESAHPIDPATALALVQSLHRHLEPDAVLEVLWHQARSLVAASGLAFHPATGNTVFAAGTGGHTASYRLSHQDRVLGELVVRFQRPAPEPTLAATEALVALAMPAIRHALDYDALCQMTAAGPGSPAPATGDGPDEPGDAGPGDALVLVGLDDFELIRARDGAGWAQTLLESVQSQIREGLREADSVFQIDEGLLAVLLPQTGEPAALEVAGKIRVLIAGLHLRDGPATSQLTACMGISCAREPVSPDEVLEQARWALSRARRQGSNSVQTFPGSGGSGQLRIRQ